MAVLNRINYSEYVILIIELLKGEKMITPSVIDEVTQRILWIFLVPDTENEGYLKWKKWEHAISWSTEPSDHVN